MTAQADLKRALRDVLGPIARQNGFKGTAPTWRKTNENGDWAIVNVQSSGWSSADQVQCIINLSVVPGPWLRWMRYTLGPAAPKSVTEYLGLYRTRVHRTGAPEGAGIWWDVIDEPSAFASAADMVDQLAVDGWPILDRLLGPRAMLDQVRGGDLGYVKRANFDVYFARAEAILLMDQGPSRELDECLATALKFVIPTQRKNAETFDRWVRANANAAVAS